MDFLLWGVLLLVLITGPQWAHLWEFRVRVVRTKFKYCWREKISKLFKTVSLETAASLPSRSAVQYLRSKSRRDSPKPRVTNTGLGTFKTRAADMPRNPHRQGQSGGLVQPSHRNQGSKNPCYPSKNTGQGFVGHQLRHDPDHHQAFCELAQTNQSRLVAKRQCHLNRLGNSEANVDASPLRFRVWQSAVPDPARL